MFKRGFAAGAATILIATSSLAQEAAPAKASATTAPSSAEPQVLVGPPPAEPPAPTPAPSRPWVAGYKNGFTLQSESGDYKLRFAGLVQADGRFAPGDDSALVADSFLMRRVRPGLQGTVAQYFDFAIVPDFGLGTTVLQDAWMDVNFTPKLRVRAGKMKVPFGLERLQSGANLLFVERAFPTLLAPNRDVGVQVHGELAQGAFAYQVALMNGVPDGGMVESDTNDSKDLAGRVFVQPWKTRYTNPLRGLGVGFAATHGEASQGSLASAKGVLQVNVFSWANGVTATGDRDRLSPQAWFYLGPVGFLGEYVQSSQTVARTDANTKATLTQDVTNSSWSVTGSVFLTGEDASYGSVKPKSFFVPSAGHWGAFQLVARVHQLDVDDAVFTGGFAEASKSISRATAWGVGLNWIWNTNLKYVIDYDRTVFEGGAAAGADRPTEQGVATRLQLSF